MRARTNQPSGWDTSRHGHNIRYDFRDHDYIYYPHSWTDESGVEHPEGYYDENGVYYRNVCAANTQTMLTCEFCGTKSLWEWKEGTIPSCSSCGAQIKIDKIDVALPNVGRSGGVSKKTWMIPLFVYLGLIVTGPLLYLSFLLPASLFGIITHKAKDVRHTSATTARTEITRRVQPSSVFVEEINRNCYLDGEDYYDKETQCWFWYNTDVDPGQWQYWYEGISSDYGDYGWLEHGSDGWFVEASAGNWIPLPSTYDTSGLWYID